MKKTNSISRIMLLLISSVVCFSAFAQEDGLFKQVLYDHRSDQIIKVFERAGDSYTISEGPYIGYPAKDHFYTIMFSSGEKRMLEKNEVVEGNADGNLMTMKYDQIHDRTIVSCYTISKNNFSLIKQLSLDGHQEVNLLENGTMIISDQYELYGTLISVYDKHLQLLNSIHPFENGYQKAHFIFTENKIIIIAQQAEPAYETKYIEVKPANGSILFQISLEKKNLDIVKLLAINDKIILIEPSKIIAIMRGSLIWEKDLTLPNYDIITNSSQHAIYYCLSDKLIKLSADDGTVLFTKKLSDLIIASEDLKNQMIRPIIFRSLPGNSNTLIVLAETNKGFLMNTTYKNNPQVYIIYENGNFIKNQKLKLSPFRWVEIVEKMDNKVSLILDNQQIEIQ